MKIAVREVALMILALVGAIFFIHSIFGENDDGKLSIFDGVTGVVEQMNSTEPKSESVNFLQSQGLVTEPVVKFILGSVETNTEVSFKDMFEVTVGSQTHLGSEENGFAIYLKNIKDTAGNSRLVSLNRESIDASDDIYSDFVYDIDQDILYIYSSGCYSVYLTVYTDAGAVVTYEFTLPVE